MQNFRWGLIAAIGAAFISIALGILFGVNIVHILLRALIFGCVFLGLGFGLRFLLSSFFPEVLFPEEDTGSDISLPGTNIDITLDSTGEYAVPELFRAGDAEELGNIEDLVSGVFRAGFGPDQAESSAKTGDAVDARGESGYNGAGYFGGLEAGMPDAGGSSAGGFASSLQGFTPLPIEGGDDIQDLSLFQKPDGAVPVSKQPVFQEQFTPSLGEDSGLGGLPDLDMMGRAFSSFDAPPPSPSSASMSSAPSSFSLDEEEQPDRSQYNKGNKPQALQGDFQAKDIARGLSTLLSKDK